MRKRSKSFNCELTGEPVAVVNLGLPVASLPEYVKGKTSGATNSGQPERVDVYHVILDLKKLIKNQDSLLKFT